ncbi:MAG: hypothetical protein ACLP9L_38915 [Thermoguttaceae bacterium]
MPFLNKRRTIVFMLHAEKHKRRLELCNRTWLRDARKGGQGVLIVRTIDDPTWPAITTLHGSELWVPVEDTLKALPQQIRHVCRWALQRDDWDYLFKCDDDTYLSIPRFLKYSPHHDYRGQRLNYGGLRYAHGGAGYFLSRRAVQVLADKLTQLEGAEDWWVGEVLKRNGINLVHDGNFFGKRKDGPPRRENWHITGHHISERQWWQAHKETGLDAADACKYPEIRETPETRNVALRRQRQQVLGVARR